LHYDSIQSRSRSTVDELRPSNIAHVSTVKLIWINAKTQAPGHGSTMIMIIDAAAVVLALAIGLAVTKAQVAQTR
jgi:hypothetical protein